MITTKSFTRISAIVIVLILALSSVHPAYAAPPANDYFADAEVVNSLPFSTTVDITEAGIEPNEPQSCSAADRTAWYSFTPAETMYVSITSGGNYGKVGVYTASGPDISDLNFFWCPLYNPAPKILEAGQTYYIQVGHYLDGTMQINMEQVFPPSNDNFSNAAAITSLPFSTTVDVTYASLEPGEVRYCSMETKTIWYSFTPPVNMLIRADTLGSEIGSQVTIYKATGGGVSGQSFLGCSVGSSFSFIAEVGQTYYFQVGNIWYGDAGNIQFNLTQLFPPGNDNFSNAEIITSLPFRKTIDVSDATIEPDEQQWCYGMDRTVWYSFTPPETIEVRADFFGTTINSNMNIYLAYGPGISDLDVLTCTIVYGPFSFIAEKGKTYYLQAGGTGTGTVTLELEAVKQVIEVSIDIKPGSGTNPINTKSKGKIPVAILSTPDFDAPSMVDVTSLTFGKTGDETSLTFCNKGSEDVNDDGLQDQVCHFYNKGTGFQKGDVEGFLKGQTLDGIPIEGYDSVKILK